MSQQIHHTANPEVSCERVELALQRFYESGDVLWAGSRMAYKWLSANLPAEYSVLDVGCGAGFGTYLLQPRLVVGIDKQQKSIDFARVVYPRMQWAQWDIALSPYPQQFDTVVMAEIIEHIDDWTSALENAKQCARRTVVLTTPNRDAAEPVEQPTNRQHVREFVFDELASSFAEGWQVRKYAHATIDKLSTFIEVTDVAAYSPMMLIARRVA